MSAFKGTPGPWVLETVPTQISSCHKIGPFPGSRARPVGYACVYADGEHWPDRLTDTGKELLANARLIAAAPDSHAANVAMVNALNVAFGITSEHDDEYIYDTLPASGVANAYFAARAAIAKGTGEQS